MKAIIKAFTWRLTATATTYIVAYVTTGCINIASKIAIGEFIIKILVFWVHENFWERKVK
jgi:uncharacterized membrane protein